MGQKHLRIVASEVHTMQGARNTAYESHDLLETIETFDSLETAVADMELVIGTTGKPRKLRYEMIPSDLLPKFLDDKAAIASKVALIFGSESNGLSKEEENRCDVLSSIPMTTSYPSINLSHSVMIYAYELLKSTSGPSKPADTTDNKGDVSRAVKEQSHQLLSELQMPDQQPGLYRRITDKIALMNEPDSRLVLSLLRYLRKLRKNDR